MRLHILFPAFILGCLFITPARPSGAVQTGEVRALWVARTTLTSPAAIDRMVQTAHAAGFNTLLVQVRARGDAYYAGGSEPRAAALAAQPTTFDPLGLILADARRAGLRVHAWISVNLVSSAVDLPSSRSHVIYRHPEWLMVPRGAAAELRGLSPRQPLYLAKLARACRQQSADVEGLFLSPIDPDAAEYIARVVGDIIDRYPVDGVHLDYVRYPSEEFDYSQRALSLFSATLSRTLKPAEARRLRRRATAHPLVYAEEFPDPWREFRRSRLTALVERLRASVKARRPGALLTAAVVPDPREASERRLQDWQRWAATGAIDIVCPMAYAVDAPAFAAQLDAARRAASGRELWAGIGAYRLSAAQTIENIRIARRGGAAGVVLFSYDSLIGAAPDGALLSEIGRTAFGRP